MPNSINILLRSSSGILHAYFFIGVLIVQFALRRIELRVFRIDFIVQDYLIIYDAPVFVLEFIICASSYNVFVDIFPYLHRKDQILDMIVFYSLFSRSF